MRKVLTLLNDAELTLKLKNCEFFCKSRRLPWPRHQTRSPVNKLPKDWRGLQLQALSNITYYALSLACATYSGCPYRILRELQQPSAKN